MGFNLELMFKELFEILESDMKDSKKVKALYANIAEARRYGKECGVIK